MIHQIVLETLDLASQSVKRTETKLTEYESVKEEIKDKKNNKNLLKIYSINEKIENDLKHLVNVLDIHIDSVLDEVEIFKNEISSVSLKNKAQQIGFILKANDDEDS